MLEECSPLSFVAAASLLRQCSHPKALAKGREVHARLVRSGLDQDGVCGNLLVRMYGKCGQLDDAKAVFDGLIVKNVYSWNVVTAAYAQNGFLPQARALFDRMPQWSLVSWNTITNGYAHLGWLEESKELFDQIPVWTVVSWNAMVLAYARNGYMQEASSMFDEMLVRDELTWNTIISGNIVNKEFAQARWVFAMMPATSIVSWNCVVVAYAREGQTEEAKEMFVTMPEKDIVAWNSLLAGYEQEANLNSAKRVFNRMPYHDAIAWNSMLATYVAVSCTHGSVVSATDVVDFFKRVPQKDLISWTSLIAALAFHGLVEQAKLLFDKLPQRDAVSWTSFVVALAQAGHMNEARQYFRVAPYCDIMAQNTMIFQHVLQGSVDEAKKIFDNLSNRNVVSWNSLLAGYTQPGQAKSFFDQMPAYSIVSWSSMVAAYGQQGQGEEALSVLRTMDIEGIYPDAATFTSVLAACSTASALHLGRMVYQALLTGTKDLEKVEVGTAVVCMFGKCGSLVEARQVFDRMTNRNLLSWNTMVGAYAQKGHVTQVTGLLLVMVHEGYVPDEVTMLSVFSACSHEGLVSKCQYYFLAATSDYGVDMIPDHFRCMIDMYSRLGHLEEAENVILGMPFEADASAWKALLSACRVHGDVNRAEKVAKRIMSIEPRVSSPYVQLASIYTQF